MCLIHLVKNYFILLTIWLPSYYLQGHSLLKLRLMRINTVCCWWLVMSYYIATQQCRIIFLPQSDISHKLDRLCHNSILVEFFLFGYLLRWSARSLWLLLRHIHVHSFCRSLLTKKPTEHDNIKTDSLQRVVKWCDFVYWHGCIPWCAPLSLRKMKVFVI